MSFRKHLVERRCRHNVVKRKGRLYLEREDEAPAKIMGRNSQCGHLMVIIIISVDV